MSVKAFVLCLFLPAAASAQGFAGLGAAAEDYAEVTRPAELAFPRDHGPHPAFRVEWWYLTAALTDADGRDFGAQWTLFRIAGAPDDAGAGWENRQVWMGHAGLTTPERHFHAERFARGGIGQAGALAEPFEAWIDDWSLASLAEADDAFDALRATARGEDFGYALEGRATGPLVRHGENGFSQKSDAGLASYYYSQPFLQMRGTIEIEGAPITVTGTGWVDREWSSQNMTPEQEGWDWFSLHLDDGHRLMAFRMRDRSGGGVAFGTWIAQDGTARPLGAEELSLTPTGWEEVAGRSVPVEWRVEAPGLGLAVDTAPVNPQSWMGGTFPYWEGPIRLRGSHSGRGYLEMTGYEP